MMHPNAEQKYREESHKESGNYNLATNVCHRCRKTRSAFQFIDNPKICRTCRTGK